MSSVLRVFLSGAVLLGLMATPCHGQDYRGAVGITMGSVGFGQLNKGPAAAQSDLTLDRGWGSGLELERWTAAGRFGMRLRLPYVAAYFDRSGQVLTSGGVSVWMPEAGLLIRLLAPDPERRASPFISLGAGAVHYSPPFSATWVDEHVRVRKGTEPSLSAGAGLDLWGSGRFAVRLEVADQVTLNSPLTPVAGDKFDAVHHLRFSASVRAVHGRLMMPDPVRREADVPAPEPVAPPVEREPPPEVVAGPDQVVGLADVLVVDGDDRWKFDNRRILVDQRLGTVTIFDEAGRQPVMTVPLRSSYILWLNPRDR